MSCQRFACRERCIPIVTSSAALQASLVTAPGGTYFSSPLGVALSSYMEEPQCRAALLSALNSLASSSGVQKLSQPGAPDQQTEVALVRSLCAQDQKFVTAYMIMVRGECTHRPRS